MNFIARLFLLALLVCFPSKGEAQEVGTGLICDTKAQVEQFVKLSNEGVANEAAIGRINADGQGCAILSVAYLRGDKVGEIRTKSGGAEIFAIVVVGVNPGMGWIRGAPLPQFTLFLIKGENI